MLWQVSNQFDGISFIFLRCYKSWLIQFISETATECQRGAANGVSTTAMSFFKAIGPAGAGIL
jgi:hypothetical protein